MYCGAAVTILSGAVAERMRFGSYIIIACLVSSVIYPVYGHWAWKGLETNSVSGWLGAMGFVDFAGSSVIHSVGGWVALAALLVVGPRSGRFSGANISQKISGANIPLAVLGVMLLWFGWFGFTGGSTFSMNDQVPKVLFNTFIGGAAGMVATLTIGWIIWQRADLLFVINGSLAGLVAITANCHAVNTRSAIFIGAIGGLIMLGVSKFLEKCKIDDAVGAIPVHLGAGIWGTLAVGIFGKPEFLHTGLSQAEQLKIQIIGIATCAIWTFSVSYIALYLLNRFFRLRVTPKEEHLGLNISEHGASSEMVELVNVMELQAKTGDLALRAPVEPFTEVGQIAILYNRVMKAFEQAVVTTEAIVQTAMDGIITFTEQEFHVTTLNPSAEAIFKFERSKIIGRPIGLLLDLEGNHDKGSSPNTIGTAMLKEITSYNRRELTGRRADGSTFPMEVTITHAKAGDKSFYTGTFRDITERKTAMEQLKKSKEAAEIGNKTKSEFLANMSHEHRTPLNGILGYAQILKNDSSLTAKQRKAVGIIEKSGQHLLMLINEVLDFSKVEAGKMDLMLTDIDFKKFLRGIIEMIRLKAVEKGISFYYKPLSELPDGIQADEKKVRQILLNLLGNAVKFTKDGSVTFRVGYHQEKMRFLIEDTGIGVDQDKLEEIFYAFHQVGDRTQTTDGTGLGLAISKKLVEMMGGELKVQSTSGKGSSFWFDLALSDVSYRITPFETQIRRFCGVVGEKRKVLIADDKAENRNVLHDILTSWGFEVIEAFDGEDCIEKALEFKPNVILMDLIMPKLDGFESAKKIRSYEALQDVVIMAISANVSDHFRERSLKAGMDTFIPKPIQHDQLIALLSEKLDLEFKYDETTDPSSEMDSDINFDHGSDKMNLPPLEETNLIIELAIRGDIKRILEHLDTLEKMDEKFQPFVDEVRKLAKRFQVKKILEVIYKWKSDDENEES